MHSLKALLMFNIVVVFSFYIPKLIQIKPVIFRSAIYCSTSEPLVNQSPKTTLEKSNELPLMEIRIGKITGISKHPEAESLYVEDVDIGESTGPRVIVSGLVQFCSAEELLHKKVIVLCNLKPRALKGITSYGMLLCASNADHSKVEPLSPAENSIIGELVTFDGYVMSPVEPGNKATKAFGKIADDFYVNDDNLATFRGIPFMTSSGPITSSLKGKIS